MNTNPKNMCGFVEQQLDVQVIEGKINEVLLKTNTVEHLGNTFEAVAYQFEFIVGPYLTLDALAKLSLACLLYTSPSPRDPKISRMPSSA